MLTKDIIFQLFNSDTELLKYIPSEPNLKVIPRDFLLTILANIRRDKYANLYAKYKEIQAERSTGGNKIYKAQITNQFFNGLQNFVPVNL